MLFELPDFNEVGTKALRGSTDPQTTAQWVQEAWLQSAQDTTPLLQSCSQSQSRKWGGGGVKQA